MNQYQVPPQDGNTAGAGASQGISITWQKIPGLFLFSLKLFFLRIITLNIYNFWGKTEMRRKLWSAISLQGQPLQYTGKGMELFLGFVVVFLLFFAPLTGFFVYLELAYLPNDPTRAMITSIALPIIYIVMFYLINVAVYKARHYRLTRTNWRGIRGSMSGSSWSYAWTAFWTSFVIVLTLGWMSPWRANKLQRILTNETRFGSVNMQYHGDTQGLYGPYAISWFGSIVALAASMAVVFFAVVFFVPDAVEQFDTYFKLLSDSPTPPPFPPALIGIIVVAYIIFFFVYMILVAFFSSFYYSKLMNHFAASTYIDQARFSLQTKAMGLFGLILAGILTAILTLGIFMPIIQGVVMGYFVRRLDVEGSVDFNMIAQSQAALGKTGEGLAEAFEVDIF